MDNFLNFVYDDWDDVNDTPRPNRLKSYVHPDDNENTWVLSTQPMSVFHRTKIQNWRMSDVPTHPEKIFYYHVWNRNGWNNRFFADDKLPIDNEVIHMIKTNKNLHLIIMNECEFESKQSLERLDKIVKLFKINPNQVWFIHNGEKLREYKEELNASINVHTTRSMSTAIQGTHPPVKYRTLKSPNQFFLCHNRAPRIHRYGLLCLLKHYNVLDNTNWSLIAGYYFNNQKFLFKNIFRFEDAMELLDEIQYFTTIDIKKSNYETQYSEIDDREVQRLPSEPSSYENSYVNIVTETNFVGEDIHITEKSFRPFYHYQFPMILASYQHLKYFREAYPDLDFFDDVIDHGYDFIENDRDRLFAFAKEIQKINENKEFFIQFYKDNKHRFQRNHDILHEWQNDYDYEFFKQLSEVTPEIDDVDMHVVYDNWNEDLQEPYDMNCKEIYTDSFLMDRDSFIISLGFPEFRIKRYPLRDVVKYPNRKFYYYVTLTPNHLGNKIRNKLLPIPQEVIDCLRNNQNFYVVFGNEQEYEHYRSFRALNFWVKVEKLNPNQIYMINNNIELKSYKEQLNSEINVYTTAKVNTDMYISMTNCMPNLQYKADKVGKLFLCHNRRVRPHRYGLLALLQREGILDNVNWSLVGGYEAFKFDKINWYNEILEVSDVNELLPEIEYFHSIDIKKCMYEEDKTWFDNKENPDDIYWGETYTEPAFMESYFNIVTESEYHSNTIHISEKSFKPLVGYQFPLILASPNHIKAIRDRFGFDWFDDVIDHSYDSILDHRERLFAFVKEVKRINDNKEFFIDFYKNNKERFENNNLLALKLTKDKSDLDYLKKLTGLYDYEFKTGLREKQSEII
jgi:hypothetical protein